jgi:hypothetical protein
MLSTADGGRHWQAEAMDDAVFATSAESSGSKVRLAVGAESFAASTEARGPAYGVPPFDSFSTFLTHRRQNAL